MFGASASEMIKGIAFCPAAFQASVWLDEADRTGSYTQHIVLQLLTICEKLFFSSFIQMVSRIAV